MANRRQVAQAAVVLSEVVPRIESALKEHDIAYRRTIDGTPVRLTPIGLRAVLLLENPLTRMTYDVERFVLSVEGLTVAVRYIDYRVDGHVGFYIAIIRYSKEKRDFINKLSGIIDDALLPLSAPEDEMLDQVES